MAVFRRFTRYALAALVLVLAGFPCVRMGANYYGYCTDPGQISKWRHITADETLTYLKANAPVRNGHPTQYRMPLPGEVTGDNHYPRTFSSRIAGRTNHLIMAVFPGAPENGLHKQSLFYTPNCLTTYRPKW